MKFDIQNMLLSCLVLTNVSLAAAREPDAMWTYKEVDGKSLQLSVFLPDGYADSEETFPTMVIYHGGSWRAGEPDWHYPDCEYYSKRGMIAVSVDYRLKDRDNIQVPLECVKDAKSAIRFLRKNAEELKVNPDKIVAAGGSAGGQLAASLATITREDTNDDCYDLSISCVPQLVVLWNPWFRCEAYLSPPNFISDDLPPFITFLGDEDIIPVEEILSFHESLKSVGVESEFYVGKGGKHGFCNGRNPYNPYFYWSVKLIDQFLVKHGFLAGCSSLEIPEDVRELTFPEDYYSHK
ncbi:alpha/beta hydrolase [Puniceicoccales bacterium CK1056]|uniref:Alpha/beta hydrolase n=1 Tax=Oceanipulchritudo coccoides TaxID=2706888 RepID=A0A6B2M2P3_9BACT|nr:alpha/beta hydrolase [Oceanipulchritudo coccoides]NDV62075.1 alpha/beta hydrolase [Oceanipulchritudo coccoides]